MKTLSVIGAGNLGAQIARAAVAAGLSVVIANSRGPESLAELVSELGPAARAADPADAATAGDLVVLCTPLNSYPDLPAAQLEGKVLVDATNYYPELFGPIPEFDSRSMSSSEFLQSRLPGSVVIKALNNLGAADLTTDGQPAGSPGRRALAVAGDDPDAKARVVALVDALGFDVIDAGPLSEGWRFQRDQPAYGIRLDADQMRAALSDAKR
ncbi:NADP oxidoreductase [Kribbella sp. ALI-6-A]|uniref:NADPH-dependent F420 reductase n=1 Tax=Kribbella sp. ALI-6-A TaxID=1933817 RepID=UPI00097C7A46|nr:NAD(P)-binding domain-containing protein [Kribbella sp. ALI-6-A]ONI75815.1 NADP oxidoreductase [Kribbella sp. ALI-6-A]